MPPRSPHYASIVYDGFFTAHSSLRQSLDSPYLRPYAITSTSQHRRYVVRRSSKSATAKPGSQPSNDDNARASAEPDAVLATKKTHDRTGKLSRKEPTIRRIGTLGSRRALNASTLRPERRKPLSPKPLTKGKDDTGGKAGHSTQANQAQTGSLEKKPPDITSSDSKPAGPSTTTWLRKLWRTPSAARKAVGAHGAIDTIEARDLKLQVVDAQVSPAPQLAFGLDRVLFNTGVHHLRDLHSRVYNFDPWLENVPDIKSFDFQTLNPFTPPSQDSRLIGIAQNEKKKYFGSTSSMTGLLKQFHFLLSNFRPLNLSHVSRAVPLPRYHTVTKITAGPDAIFLRRKGKDIYAIDADKLYDNPNILSLMGTYMETFFTTSKQQFTRHLHGSRNPIRDDERTGHDSYHYSTLGDMVMRSQLDAHDPRLPGAGIFDLKTRAVLPIRMSSGSSDLGWATGYELQRQHGEYFSYEREFLDMCRSTMLKYSLQVRMGRMDGIFVAYHNIARVFGFEYMPLSKLDQVMHGQEDPALGDQEFLASLELINKVLNKATEHFPDQSLRLHFDSTTYGTCLHIFVEPVTETEAQAIQDSNRHSIKKFEDYILGLSSSDDLLPCEPKSNNPKSDSAAARNGEIDGVDLTRSADTKNEQEDQLPSNTAGGSTSGLLKSWQDLRSYFSGPRDQGDIHPSEPHVGATLESKETSSQATNTQKSGFRLELELDDLERLRVVERTEPPQDQKDHGRATTEDPPAQKEILGLKLYAASVVNGKIVERPENLTSTDTWEIHSRIDVMGKDEAQTSYSKTLKRREALLGSWEREERENFAFIQFLKQKAAEGKKWRDALDKRDHLSGHDLNKRMWNDEVHFGGDEQSTIQELHEIKEDMDSLLKPAKLVLHGRDLLTQAHAARLQARQMLDKISARSHPAKQNKATK